MGKAPMKTMTSREANQDFSRAKREAKSGPVIMTERGRPCQLMTYNEYQRLVGKPRSLLDELAMPESEDIERELPERRVEPLQDLS